MKLFTVKRQTKQVVYFTDARLKKQYWTNFVIASVKSSVKRQNAFNVRFLLLLIAIYRIFNFFVKSYRRIHKIGKIFSETLIILSNIGKSAIFYRTWIRRI